MFQGVCWKILRFRGFQYNLYVQDYLEQVSQRGRFAWKLQWSQCTAQGTSVAGHPKVYGISMISNPPQKKVLKSWVSIKENE